MAFQSKESCASAEQPHQKKGAHAGEPSEWPGSMARPFALETHDESDCCRYGEVNSSRKLIMADVQS